jgi:hypothetical protein
MLFNIIGHARMLDLLGGPRGEGSYRLETLGAPRSAVRGHNEQNYLGTGSRILSGVMNAELLVSCLVSMVVLTALLNERSMCERGVALRPGPPLSGGGVLCERVPAPAF